MKKSSEKTNNTCPYSQQSVQSFADLLFSGISLIAVSANVLSMKSDHYVSTPGTYLVMPYVVRSALYLLANKQTTNIFKVYSPITEQ